jgi:hypothetical protein
MIEKMKREPGCPSDVRVLSFWGKLWYHTKNKRGHNRLIKWQYRKITGDVYD